MHGWYTSFHAVVTKSDEDHRQFFEVLESTYAQLSPLTKVKAKASTRPPTMAEASTNTSTVVENSFGALAIEDYDDADEASDLPESTQSRLEGVLKVADVVIEKDQTEIKAEFFFAIECFLLDLQAMRDKVMAIWGRYKTTGYDLSGAALTTNFTIGM